MSGQRNNYKFKDSMLVNDDTYYDFLHRLKRIALAMFEWHNLPKSMNAEYLEQCLYYLGRASLLYSKKYGYINTKCTGDGRLNIYRLPVGLHCYSYDFYEDKELYTGLNDTTNPEDKAILVKNNYDMYPTSIGLELYALRLYEVQRTIDTNVIAQKTPIMIMCDETQRLTMENLYNQYNGNQPFIFGNKQSFQNKVPLEAINTEAPIVFDKLQTYKINLMNEALTYLGINNINVEKKERLIESESNENNEYINLNLQNALKPRQRACEMFNELFKPEKEIYVTVNSDLDNIIKRELAGLVSYESEGDEDE